MIAYRDATPADGPALDRMAERVWRDTFGPLIDAANADAYLATAYGPEGRLLRDLADRAHRFRLACDGDTIVGYAKLCPPWLPDAEPGAMQLHQLYVGGAFHGSGVAATLMDWTIATARDAGATALLLTVWEENPRARRFYARYGFEHVGDYAFVVGEQVDTDHILRLAL